MATDNGPTADLAGLKQCDDFIQFEHALRQSRAIDDKIIQALNNSIPTDSFRSQVDVGGKCQDLWNNIESTYANREAAINTCIRSSEQKVASLKASGDRSGTRQTQVMLRMLQSELTVEEVIRSRTHTAFHEKCRDHFKPGQVPS